MMERSESVAVVTVFTALVVGSDFALSPYPNVKLFDTLVFVAAFVYGFRVGAAVGVLSETIWGFVSPNGMAGIILPFLAGGELLFAFAGYAASRVWTNPMSNPLSVQNLFFGALMAVCAFAWDFETNLATGLLAGATTISSLLWYEAYGIPFMFAHETSDLVFGTLAAPPLILYTWQAMKGRTLRVLGATTEAASRGKG